MVVSKSLARAALSRRDVVLPRALLQRALMAAAAVAAQTACVSPAAAVLSPTPAQVGSAPKVTERVFLDIRIIQRYDGARP